MGLVDDLQTADLAKRRPSIECSVCALLRELPKHEADALQEALDNPKVYGSALARVLTANGHPIKQDRITRHRRGDCAGTRV